MQIELTSGMIIIASLTSDEQCVDLLFVIYSSMLWT